MSTQDSDRHTMVLLSFNSAYSGLARQIVDDLQAANIEIRYDQWEGGGVVPAIQSVACTLDDVAFVLLLMTPSDATRSWIGDEWKHTIYDKALAQGIKVLPILGDGDQEYVVPDYFDGYSFANLHKEYSHELHRLIETIRELSGDTNIRLPIDEREISGIQSPMTLPDQPLVLKVGEELQLLFEGDKKERFLNEMIPMMHDGLFFELGVLFPMLHLRASAEVPPSSILIVINDVPEAREEIHPDWVVVNASVEEMNGCGIGVKPAINPATGARCTWIPADKAASINRSNLVMWNAHEFVILRLSATLREKAAHFIGVDEAEVMLNKIKPTFPQLIAETVPATVSPFILTDVLQRLVAEHVSIRNLRRILMALADWGRTEHDPLYLTEYVRAALQRQITHQLSRGTNQLVVFLLHPELERMIQKATRHTVTGSYVDLEPEKLRDILQAIQKPVSTLPDGVQMPQILTTMEIRSSVRRLVARSMPWLHVVSYQELMPTTNIQPVARISLDGFSQRSGASVDGKPLWS